MIEVYIICSGMKVRIFRIKSGTTVMAETRAQSGKEIKMKDYTVLELVF